jgi:hypothetical protein
MRKAILIAVAVGALVVGGTALAYPGGPGPFGNHDERQAEFAGDLASELDGVNANEVEQALDTVREQKMAEHREALAEAISGQLDGVSAEQVESALETHEAEVRDAIENGERPERGSLVTTLADELGKSEDEIQTALEAAHEEKSEERLSDAVESGDLTEEEADQIRERMENGTFGHGPGGPGGHRGFGGPFGGPRGPGGPAADGQGTSIPAPSIEAPAI